LLFDDFTIGAIAITNDKDDDITQQVLNIQVKYKLFVQMVQVCHPLLLLFKSLRSRVKVSFRSNFSSRSFKVRIHSVISVSFLQETDEFYQLRDEISSLFTLVYSFFAYETTCGRLFSS